MPAKSNKTVYVEQGSKDTARSAVAIPKATAHHLHAWDLKVHKRAEQLGVSHALEKPTKVFDDLKFSSSDTDDDAEDKKAHRKRRKKRVRDNSKVLYWDIFNSCPDSMHLILTNKNLGVDPLKWYEAIRELLKPRGSNGQSDATAALYNVTMEAAEDLLTYLAELELAVNEKTRLGVATTDVDKLGALWRNLHKAYNPQRLITKQKPNLTYVTAIQELMDFGKDMDYIKGDAWDDGEETGHRNTTLRPKLHHIKNKTGANGDSSKPRLTDNEKKELKEKLKDRICESHLLGSCKYGEHCFKRHLKLSDIKLQDDKGTTPQLQSMQVDSHPGYLGYPPLTASHWASPGHVPLEFN
jgi:hypothetical protein